MLKHVALALLSGALVAIGGKAAGGRTLTVRRVSTSQPASGCPILFLNSPECKRFRSVVESLKGSGDLRVGQSEEFAADGGVVNFRLEHGNIRLEINMAATEYAQVRISSKLLELAPIVRRPQ
jgi:hypothetical protein